MKLNNKNDNDASNIVIDNDTMELVVPETQTQIVDATQYDTESIDDKDQLPEDCNTFELEKTPGISRFKTEKKLVRSMQNHYYFACKGDQR